MNVTAAGLHAPAGLESTPQSIKDAAEAFEALFIGQLLKSAREARNSGSLDDGDSSGGPMMEMADEHLAQQIAKGGGCGLSQSIILQFDSAITTEKASQNKHSIGSRSSVSK